LLPVLSAAAVIIAACGGANPTQPSGSGNGSTTPTSPAPQPPAPPGPSAPTGTIKLVSTNPPAGADIVITSQDRGPTLTAVFSVQFDQAIPDAALRLDLLDASGRVCASGETDKQPVAAGQALQYSVAKFTVKCDMPAATDTFKTTIVAASNSSGQPVPTEFASATFPAHYSFKVAPPPAPPTPQGGISFVGSDPAPGGEIALDDIGGIHALTSLHLNFAVLFGTALPDAKFQVSLFDQTGADCFLAIPDHPIPAGAPETISIDGSRMFLDGQSGTCATYPLHIAGVKATLFTLREPVVNGRLQRTDYLTQSFPIAYTIQRFPPPPPNAPPSAPVVSDLIWRDESNIPTCCDPPLPDDVMNATCVAREADGAPMTVTLTLAWDGLPPAPYTSAFPAGASSSSEGAKVSIGFSAPKTGRLHATLTCAATNNRGQTANRSTEIGR
jgi:hypothetical protein